MKNGVAFATTSPRWSSKRRSEASTPRPPPPWRSPSAATVPLAGAGNVALPLSVALPKNAHAPIVNASVACRAIEGPSAKTLAPLEPSDGAPMNRAPR